MRLREQRDCTRTPYDDQDSEGAFQSAVYSFRNPRWSQEGKTGGEAIPPAVTLRESVLISLIAAGLKNREIAVMEGESEHVTKNRIKVIFDKLGFSNRVELALWYVKQLHDRGACHLVP